MQDQDERDDALDLLALARCRESLAGEADGLTDQDIDRIRRHAHAMAHAVIDAFLHQAALGDVDLQPTSQDSWR
jgi:hypothetical protein